MARRAAVVVTTTVVVGLLPAPALAGGGHGEPTPGAPGIGDAYYPLDGNGGYDVEHYDLDVRYDPATDVLQGVATITARAVQDLSSFNLDLEGMAVRAVRVGSADATWAREGATAASCSATDPREVRMTSPGCASGSSVSAGSASSQSAGLSRPSPSWSQRAARSSSVT